MNRDTRLTILAQHCIMNNINPQTGNYAAQIRRVAITYLGANEAQAKELTRSLTTAYYTDKWTAILPPPENFDEVAGNTGLEPNRLTLKPGEATIENVTQQSNTEATSLTDQRVEVHTTMANMFTNTPTEPIKKLIANPTHQQDRLTEKQICKILKNIAEKNCFGSTGRITIFDARDAADNKHLQISEVQDMWRRNYPTLEAETRSNVLLIYFDGKNAGQLNIYNPKIQPREYLFNSKSNPDADIIDEEYDETAPEEKD